MSYSTKVKEYFSDIESGKGERVVEEIPVPVWNGIVTVYERFKTENYFASSFPSTCPDNKSICWGFDNKSFEDRVKSEIPNIDIPIARKKERISILDDWKGEAAETVINKYAVLDFLMFCHKHIKKPIKGQYHDFFGHHHLSFQDDPESKKEFIKEINLIFERNGIVFFLNDHGQINRAVPTVFQPLINRVFNTSDTRLNELIEIAYNKFVLPKLEDRIHALEKIWDVFERVKTYYSGDKKASADQLIELVSKDNDAIKEMLKKEATALREIGNNFQIRHFETNKKEITDNKHVDYLFYRMANLLHMFLTALE